VIEIGFDKSADELLTSLQKIEQALGRNRSTPSPHSSPKPTPVPSLPVRAGLAESRASLPAGEKGKENRQSGTDREAPGEGMHKLNVSRTIDLDLLYFGSEESADTHLQLPHPRMTKRRFVLQPLCDIAPDLRLPGQTKNVGELLAELHDPAKIIRLRDKW
jgi:7,8-dihydro-6-hydroxymethylpterin-pyrophosphokinase